MMRSTQNWPARITQLHRRRKQRRQRRQLFCHKSRTVESLEPRLMLTVASDPDQPLLTGDYPLAVELGPIDTDATVDLVALSADGQLTIALNHGDDRWQTANTTDLHLGPLVGMQLAPVDHDAYQDLILQGPNSIYIALGDGTGQFTLHSTHSSVTAGTFAPADGVPLGIATSLLGGDLLTDIVTVSPGTNEVLVFQTTGDGSLPTPDRYPSGATEPVAIAVGDFLGHLAPDLAVGHRDGTVTFLEGAGDGTFQFRSSSTVTGLGTITDLTAADLDSDGDMDLAVSGTDQVNLLLNDDDPLTTSPIVNGDFSAGLTGWQTEIVGHAPAATPGSVSALGGFAQLYENQSFLVSLQQTLTIPPTPQTLSLDIVSLGLDDPAGGVPDAFEISLLDDTFNSLVPTFRSDATSFFNVSPGGPASLSPGVTFDGTTVTLDISTLTPGSQATLYVDLVGNPPGTSSVVSVDNVQVSPDVIYANSFTAVRLAGLFGAAAGIATGDVDGDGQLDIVVADSATNELLVYTGDENEPGQYIRSELDLSSRGSGPLAVALGPLTAGDSIEDVAVTLRDSHLVLSPLTVDVSNAPPVIQATSDLQGEEGENLSFTATFSDPNDPGPHTATVNWGDGSGPGSVAVTFADGVGMVTAEHIYADNGDYPIEITVTDSLGATGQITTAAAIANVPPTVTAAADQSVDQGTPLSLHVATFTDPGFNTTHLPSGPTESFTAQIDWGDGTVEAGQVLWASGGPSVLTTGIVAGSHTYVGTGDYLVTVTVTDDDGGTGSDSLHITVTASGAAKFYVVDQSAHKTFRYDDQFDLLGQSDLNHASPRGVATDPDGQTVWVVDSSRQVDVYSAAGDFLGAWQANGANHPTGIASDGTNVWIVGAAKDRVYYYADGASFLSGSHTADENFKLASNNKDPSGLATHNGTLWVADEKKKSPSVFVYDSGGTNLGQWSADTKNNDPSGITIDPASGDLWVVDRHDAVAYQYAEAASRRDGHQPATAALALEPSNHNPEGIADPVTTISIGDQVSGEISVAGEVDQYVFDATAGQWVFFDAQLLPEAAFVSVIAPNGDVLLSDYFDDHPAVELSVTGQYTLNVEDFSGLALLQPYQFQLHNVSTPTPTRVTIGDSLQDEITLPGAVYVYQFDGVPGQQVTFDADGSSTSIDWTLTDPSGQILFSDPFRDQQPLVLPAYGQYTLTVLGSDDYPLPFAFQIVGAPAVPRTIAIGTVGNGTISAPGAVDLWQFEATSGQSVFVDFQQYAGGSSEVTLFAPDGTTVYAERNSLLNDLDYGPLLLAQPGTYTLQVDGVGDDTSSYQFQLWDVPAPKEFTYDLSGATDDALGGVADGTIEIPGATDRWHFEGQADQSVFLDMQRIDGIPSAAEMLDVKLLAPDGSTIHSVTDFVVSNVDSGPLLLPQDGTYTLQLSGRGDDRARYQFQIVDVTPTLFAPIPFDTPISGAIDLPGRTLGYMFDGVAGQAIVFDVIHNQAGGVGFTLLDPNDTALLTNVTDDQPIASLPMTGTYTLLVDQQSTNDIDFTGSYSFQVIDGAIPADPPPAADLVVSQVTAPSRVIGNPAQVQVSWTVANAGQAATDTDHWIDRVILSADGTLGNLDDRSVAEVEHMAALAPAASRPQSVTLTLPSGFEGTFQVFVQTDPTNRVFEDQAELNNSAAAPNRTAVFAEPRELTGALNIELDLQDGQGFPADSNVALSGRVTPTAGTANVLFLVDISDSTGYVTGLDANFDGLLDKFDDLNGDGQVGDILDAEIGAILAVVPKLSAQAEDLRVGVVLFAATAELLDQGPAPLVQELQSPWVDNSGNGVGDLEDALRTLRTKFNTNFEDALVKTVGLLDRALEADVTQVIFLSDGEPFGAEAEPTVATLEQLAAHGLAFHAFQITGTEPSEAMQLMADTVDAHPQSTGKSRLVEDVSDLLTSLEESLEVQVTDVTINGDPADVLAAAGQFFKTVTVAEGANPLFVEAVASNGAAASTTITLIGAVQAAQVQDVTTLGQLTYSGTTFNRSTRTLHAQAQLTNLGTDVMPGPVSAVFHPIRPPSVNLANPDGQTTADQPYVTFDTELPTGGLPSGTSSDAAALEFTNPLEQRFDFDVTLLATANRAPRLSSSPVVSVVPETPYEYVAAASDPDGDTLAYALDVAPAAMTVDPTSGLVQWAPAAGDVGMHSVQLRVTDGRGGTATQVYSLQVATIVNDVSPLITSTPPRVATVGELYELTVDVADPNDTQFTFQLLIGPSGMTIRPATGHLTWTPTVADVGTHSIQIEARDPGGNAALQAYELTVRRVNTAPELTSSPVIEATAGAAYRYNADAVDADDAIQFSLTTAPSGMEINPRSGVITWPTAPTDVGDYSVVVRATDERGLFADQPYTLTVRADTEAPSVSVRLSPETVNIGQPVTIQVLASDNVGVQAVALEVDGIPVSLDADNSAQFAASSSGLLVVEGTVTDAAGNVGTESPTLRVLDPNDDQPPLVQITAPAGGAVVTYLTDIVGTVTDAGFDSYRLEYSLANANQWLTISESSSQVTADALGVFDPTLLRNDLYDIRLVAWDINGNTAEDRIQLALDGQAKVGNLRIGATDLTIPVAGGPAIEIKRTYDTIDANQSGDFGFGWNICSLDPHIRETQPVAIGEDLLGMFAALPMKEGDRVSLTGPGCRRVGFTFRPVPTTSQWSELNDFYGTIYEPRWIPDPGVDVALWGEWDWITVDGFSGTFDLAGEPLPLLRLNDGAYILAHLNVQYNPLGYQLIQKDGTRWHYSQFDGLQDVTDRNGNTLSVTADGITSSSGQAVQFQRDDQDRITRVIDPTGNEIAYTYNAAGELASVDYPNGLNSHYDYDAGAEHYLTDIDQPTDGCGAGCGGASEPVQLTYNLADRLSEIYGGAGNKNRQVYDMEAQTETIYDALGNATTQQFDDRGNVVYEVDPLGHESYFTYDSNDNLMSITDQRGFVTEMTYDDRRNVTGVTDPLGQTTLIAYNAQNDMVRQTDALGNVFEFDRDANGRITQSRGPLGMILDLVHDAQGRLISVTDTDGNMRRFEYAAGPYPIRMIQPDGSTEELTYNYLGKLASFTDENGHTTTFEYDASGRSVAILDPLGQSTTFTYTGHLLDSTTNKRGGTTTYLFDDAGRPFRVTDPQGGVTSYTYNANGDRVTETDPLGRTISYTYRTDRRLASEIDPLGNTTSYDYDASGNLTAVTDANGHTSVTTYDGNNFPISRTDALGNTWGYAYDAVANLTALTDPNDHTTTYTYDALQRMIRSVDPAGGITTHAYDLRSNLLRTTDPNGNTTVVTYDSLDRPIRQQDALGGVRLFGYDALGNRTLVIDERAYQTTYAYDALDRLISTTDATGATTHFAYNASDQLTSSVDPLGGVTSYAYDSLSQLTSISDALGGVWQFDYDAIGNLVSWTDPLGRITSTAFDVLNRPITLTDPRSGVTSYGYDAVGNQTSVTDPLGNVTQLVFDAADRLVEQIDPLGHASRFSYDSASNLTQTTDRNGRVRTFQYDAVDRRTREEWLDGATTVNSLYYSYDPVGNLLTATDTASQYTLSYDVFNRMLGSDNAGTPGPPHVVLSFGYDAAGNRTSVADNTGVNVASTYDPRNLLASRTWSAGGIDPARVDFLYNARGDRVEVSRFADVAAATLIGHTFLAYDARRRVTDITHRGPTDAILADYDYVRDLADQILSETHHGQTSTYTHDLAGQLTGAVHGGQPNEGYTYDANGNRIATGYDIGPNNQVLSDGTFNYEYDPEGNLSRKTEIATGEYTDFDFDHRNRLVRGTVKSAGGIILREVNYTYDVFDRLIARSVDSDGAGPAPAETRYTVYDGEDAWADYDASGNVIARYLFGDRTDEIIARYRPGEGTAWYLTDHLGSVRDLVDAMGALTDTITYDSFGNIVAQTNLAAGDRFTFTGREWDPDLGLYYYRARFYDPALGRFISQDPLGFDAGDVNLYRYVANRPLEATDPSGNLALTECAIVRGLRAGLAVGCPIAELWARGNFEKPTPEIRVMNAMAMMQTAFGLLPGGASMALQLTFRAITMKTTTDALAFLPGAGPVFMLAGLYDAWRIGYDPTYEGEQKGSTKLFWTRLVCGVAEMGLMVWAARPRCFVAGTPVIMDIMPQGLGSTSRSSDESDQARLADTIGSVALIIGVGAAVVQRRSRKQCRKHRRQTECSDIDPLAGDDNLAHPDPREPGAVDKVFEENTPATWLADTCGASDANRQRNANDLGQPARNVQPITAIDARQTSGTISTIDDKPEGSFPMPVPEQGRSRLLPLITLVSFLIAGICFGPRAAKFWRNTETTVVASSLSGVGTSDALTADSPRFLTRPIEQLRPGDRVLAHNPEVTDQERPTPDPSPAICRLIELDLLTEDGHRVDIRLLRPLEWIETYGAAAGSTIWLDLEELGAVGEAKVVSVSACPQIQPGRGRVITGTFRHEAANIVTVHIDGEPPIGCTANHRFWSEDRQAFVSANELQAGDRLRNTNGQTFFVASIAKRSMGEPVYNIEVDVLHTYHVGLAGILVHNTCAGSSSSSPRVIPLRTKLTAPDVIMMRRGGPRFNATKFPTKVRSKLNQLRKKYPHVRRGIKGVEDATKLAQQAVERGGGRFGPPVGQGDRHAIYYSDGPVTWVFRPNGEFWSMRTNQ